MMPGLDGWQVCREIRKNQRSDHHVDGQGETFDKVLGWELGADDYIVKPFDTKEIVARIKRCFAVRAVRRRLKTPFARFVR
jgi:two-component system response regulator ResD